MQQPIIEMHGIVKRYYIGKPNELEILHGIDLEVWPGEFVAIVGESGSGKSTLMNIIGVLDRPTEGSYTLDGVDVGKAKDSALSDIRNRKIGFVFQTFNLIGRTSAQKNVELPLLYARVSARQRAKRAKELLAQVGMSERAATSRTNFRAARSSGWPSHGRWRTSRRCFWRTNPPARWTPPPAAPSWTSFTSCTARA